MSISDLIDEYAAGPAELRKLVAGLSAEQVRARPIPGKWSILEVICHLSDFEPVYLDRLKVILVQDRPTFFGRDENAALVRLQSAHASCAVDLDHLGLRCGNDSGERRGGLSREDVCLRNRKR